MAYDKWRDDPVYHMIDAWFNPVGEIFAISKPTWYNFILNWLAFFGRLILDFLILVLIVAGLMK